MNTFDSLEKALQSAISMWTGCDWDTEFGSARANLRGLRSNQARLAARATRSDEAQYWQDVCNFLELVENDARRAARLASHAVESWRKGDIAEAFQQLEAAIELEAAYREPVAYAGLQARMRTLESVSDGTCLR